MNDAHRKADQRARTRENQRKSRARRQEHIHGLEQKLLAYRDDTRKRDIEYRLTVQILEGENRKLRHLLLSLGLQHSYIDEYLHAADNPVVGQKIAIPGVHQSGSSSGSNSGGLKRLEQPAVVHTAQVSGAASLHNMSEEDTKYDALCTCLSSDEDSGAWPPCGDILNTTLCAIAAELIDQYNTRGVGAEDIRKKLWAGFRKGLGSGGGCRVQNQVLFQVLDEISGS